MYEYSQSEIEEARRVVYQVVRPTPAYAWPTLSKRLGFTAIVKHENHTPIGSFKLRGGLVYVDQLLRGGRSVLGLVTATRGNHGQSIALAGSLRGLPCVVIVPQGNSLEKNDAMSALGATVEVAGEDFDACRAIAARRENELQYHYVPSFDRSLVLGVGTYAEELFADHPDLDRIYVPIGMGSGICGLIGARDRLGLRTEIVGVVADGAPAFALSLDAGRPVPTATADTFADGLACRDPQAEALEIVRRGAHGLVRVSEDELKDAVSAYFAATHNVAEGAGAAALAAATKDRERLSGKKVGVILSGGNIDSAVFAGIIGR